MYLITSEKTTGYGLIDYSRKNFYFDLWLTHKGAVVAEEEIILEEPKESPPPFTEEEIAEIEKEKWFVQWVEPSDINDFLSTPHSGWKPGSKPLPPPPSEEVEEVEEEFAEFEEIETEDLGE